ncbi:c-type cytochrome [Tropicibacter naphthalenivorans]|uniref:Cytochrome c556 n=1 Tax=Tropicibacter naphthalenivorans TaxID=441103 RepID=A0A0P1GC69_9RHOB|nr:cytochrome c [Tropicibacter naphthalenivorans]CUH79066.1 Cytochrome c556 [Tropicibacter naphthalenivorans]SMD03674.1 Cytochrome c556 [Tropicibacter naphthalenivorans]
MRKSLTYAVLLIAASGTMVFGEEDIASETVRERMALMEEVKGAMGILGGMAKGTDAFDATRAESARSALQGYSAQIPAVFETNETHPKSEAAPAIWDNWEDFTSRARAMETALGAMDTTTLDGVRAGLGGVGKTCSACHEAYRIEK